MDAMTTDALDLDALQAALDAMTPGKWCHVAAWTDKPNEDVRALAIDCGDYAARLSGSFAHPDDARGVVALVAAVPQLIAMARRAGELEEAGGKLLADNLDKAERLTALRRGLREALIEWSETVRLGAEGEIDKVTLDFDLSIIARLRALLEKKP